MFTPRSCRTRYEFETVQTETPFYYFHPERMATGIQSYGRAGNGGPFLPAAGVAEIDVPAYADSGDTNPNRSPVVFGSDPKF